MSNSHPQPRLGRIGIWSVELRFGDRGEATEAATELDELGYGALWIPGGAGGDFLSDIDRLLAATKRTVIASGILNIWKHEPTEVSAWWQSLSTDHQSRVLLGLGVSHSHIVGESYQNKKPLAVMREYLDQLSAANVPGNSLCLAALGPKMLELSRDRTAGAHPYLVTPEHTEQARAALGPNKLVAPEQGVVLETDPVRAREMARQALKHYLAYPNYQNSWKRLGFSDDEIANSSDRLVDALFAWGSIDTIVKRVNEHFTSGADHVCLQVITGGGVSIGPARQAWRDLASALI